MTARCEDLDSFFDQELPRDTGRAFRDHLAACARCQRVLRGRMLEAVVVGADRWSSDAPRQASPIAMPSSTASTVSAAGPVGSSITAGSARPAREPAPVAPGPAKPRPPMLVSAAGLRRWLAAAVIVPLAGAVVVLAYPQPPPVASSIALAAERSVDVRFSAPTLDRHRPYGVVRTAGGVPSERIKLADLAALERRGDVVTLVGAFALNGDLVSASRVVDELPRTAHSLTDRAAIELLRDANPAGDAIPAGGDAAAQRALSLTTEALRLEPALAQAKWNQAIALRRLGLSLVAARVFDELAAARDTDQPPGWAEEARTNAQALRDADRRRSDDWRRSKADADRMILGGPVLSDAAVAHAPSLARDAFYQALATAATPNRFDELTPLARALDARFATTALGDLIASVRGSDLQRRGPLAAELKAFIELRRPASQIAHVRAEAARHALHDIALASFLVVDESTGDDDLALLDTLLPHARDPWWTPVALAHRAYLAAFWHRDYPAAEAAERRAAPICKALRTRWCGRLSQLAGGANSQMGRADLAIDQITLAWRQAREAASPDDEVAAIDALGQAVAMRVSDDIDAAAVAEPYLEEVSLRKGTCATRLNRLDFAASTALNHHRFAEAAGHLQQRDMLEQARCRSNGLRLNGETARLRLLLRVRGSVEALRRNVARMRADGWANAELYLDFLDAGATLIEDAPRGETALRKIITRASDDPRRAYAPLTRASAYDALVESVAASGNARAVLALLGERLGAARLDERSKSGGGEKLPRGVDRCVLGVASWNRLIVAAIDARGNAVLETRDIPDGAVMIPPADVVSQAMRVRLGGCNRVDVVAPGPYLGAPKLLADDVAWVYRAGAPRPVRPSAAGPEVVVSDVAPPDQLGLPRLRSFTGEAGAITLAGVSATPERVLAEIRDAGLIVLVAHGTTSASEPTAASLVLSPDAQGDYLLTASKVSTAALTGSPTVVLAGCDAGRAQVSVEPWSLATSFLAAGARAVIAPTEPIPDDSANNIFRSLVARLRHGADAVDALVAERRAHGASAAWLSSIVVFE